MYARHFGVLIFAGAIFGIAQCGLAQQAATVNRPYDGIQAGLDAFRINEEQRQATVGQQLFLNDQMRFWNGYPTSGASTTYYGYLNPAAIQAYGYGAPLMTRANLDYLYGYGTTPAWGAWQAGGGPLAVFQPWPYIPGDIWGYRAYTQAARQPLGQQQIQTGPNRWESHPVYDPPLTMYQPQPPVDSPLLDRTPYAIPKPEAAASAPAGLAPSTDAIPPPPPRRTPREY